jgi:DNA-directed RNA polymerase subunit RPC12/RpoP
MESSTPIVCKHCGDDRQLEIIRVIPENTRFRIQYHCDTCGKDFFFISDINPYGIRK